MDTNRLANDCDRLPIKIAFGCQARVGKDTAADYLIDVYGGECKKFSTPLYDILHYAQDRLGFKREKDGQFLQYIGTEWARKKDEDIWANTLLKNIKGSHSNIYVTDLRFKNEFKLLRKNGFKLVRIIRDDASNDATYGNRNTQHQSEVDLLDIPLDEWDFVIYNNESLEELKFQLDNLVETY